MSMSGARPPMRPRMDSTYAHDTVRHHEQAFGARAQIAERGRFRWAEIDPCFTVIKLPPTPQRSAWIYATAAMSTPKDEQPLELFMLTPEDNDQIAVILAATAHFHRTEKRLALGHTVSFGEPWLPGSRCTHGLVSLPYLHGPTLEHGRAAGRAVRFLWLIPITAQERNFKVKHGLESLEQRFERQKFDYLDPYRHSVVQESDS